MNIEGLKATYGEDILELWTAHVALTQLGFNVEDIFILACPGDPGFLGVQLCTHGKEFTIQCGKNRFPSRDDLCLHWDRFVKDWNSGILDEDLGAYWDQCKIRVNIVGFIHALIAKGIRLPCNTSLN